MADADQLTRFIFDGSDVRGELVILDASYRQVLANGSYSPGVSELLGQMLAAAGLLSATMKFDGTLNIQARGEGDLSLIMADCTRQHLLRGIAKMRADSVPDTGDLSALLEGGHLAITIDPVRGERYQGIVPLENRTLAGCLEGYFSQSEQLPTRLWLFADGRRAGGLLLQALPSQEQSSEAKMAYWEHLAILADTLSGGEFLETGTETLLTRLFHRENVRLLPGTEMAFACSCSETRTARMLVTLGETEVREILRDQGIVEITCEFCHQQYRFDERRIDGIFGENARILH